MTSVERAILVITISDLSARPVSQIVTAAAAVTEKYLRILILSPLFNHPSFGGISRTERWSDVQRFLSSVYVEATLFAQDRGNVRMVFDILLKGLDEDLPETLGLGMDACFRLEGGEYGLHFLEYSTRAE
jgi:hypothetical protein